MMVANTVNSRLPERLQSQDDAEGRGERLQPVVHRAIQPERRVLEAVPVGCVDGRSRGDGETDFVRTAVGCVRAVLRSDSGLR